MSPASAQPGGANVVAGQAAISAPNASTTLITQSSQKAIIDWQSFSVAAGGAVQFAQPNNSAVTLNRVTGGAVSAIDGAIRANGQVWLINPNGVLFGQGARINVGGLLATTSDIANGDFLSGNYNFSGSSNAAVVNNGAIHTRKGGSVVLSGASVANGGLIEARAGRVVLGAADAFTVDFTGDHLLSYQVTQPVARQTTDANGNPQSATVTNTGIIRAAGGRVLMTARAAANIADGVVNNSGMVEATSARVENGEIILDAGTGDAVSSGTLDASGKKAGQTGGSVEVLGQTVTIADGAKIDVSGDAGGGQALIGGNFHGAGPQANASTITVGTASINADAIHSGNGGKVAVWSNKDTKFAGSVSARGGAQSGNGGQVETSGHTLSISGASVDAGSGGEWLLDPYDLTVNSGDASTISSALGSGTNVTLQTTASGTSGPGAANASGVGNINIDSGISWSTGATLTLDAYTGINLLAPITVSGAGGVVSKINDGGTGGAYGFGLGPTGFAGKLTFTGTPNSGQSLTVDGQAYTILYSVADVQNINSSALSLSGNYALATSLDASSFSGWVPIGTNGSGAAENSGRGFTGTFTGFGNTISNLNVNRPSSSSVGMFGYSSGVIRDIGMVGGAVSGGDNVGALVGLNNNASGNRIADAYATSTVNGSRFVGGLVGFNNSGTITNVHATGAVSGSVFDVGGLVGINYTSGTITNSYATGAVSGGAGFIYAGGLVGVNDFGSTVSGSYATGAVSGGAGSSGIGGLVGWNYSSGAIINAYATGAVTGGNASGSVGGLVGYNNLSGTVTNAYATGAVSSGTGSTGVGGLVGTNDNSSAITHGYWDTQTSRQSTGIGTDNNGQSGNVTGLTTAQFLGSLPGGFSSTVWGTGAGLFPYLVWQNSSTYIGGTPGTTAITYSITDMSATYGTLANLGTVSLTGVSAGDAGNVVGVITLYDSFNNLVTLSASLGAGIYMEAVKSLTGSASSNYTIASLGNTNGTLTIKPATLTYNANSASTAAGAAIPLLSGTVTGFVNNETLSSATTGSLLFSTAATASSAAGSYAIIGSGLSASNYVFVQAAGNSTALTITAAPPAAPVTPPTITLVITPPTLPVISTAPTITIQPLLSFTAAQPHTQLSTFVSNPSLTPIAQTPPAITPVNLVVVTNTPGPASNPIQNMVAGSGNGDGTPEPPSSSDVATNYVANSLDGGGPPPSSSPGSTPIIIPGLLHRVSGSPPGGGSGSINDSDLSAWGNAALWQ